MAYKLKLKTRQEKNKEYLENGDFDRLLVNNTPFIRTLAKTFHQPDQMDDLCQVGSIGLFKAFKSFNQESGNSFLSYAKQAILNEMRGYLMVNGNTVRTPVQMIKDKEPTKPCYSLNTPVGEDGATLEDFLASEVSEEGPDKKSLYEAINRIEKERWRDMLLCYYGMGDYQEYGPRDYKAVGDVFGCTRENSRVTINKAIKVLQDDNRFKQIIQRG